MANDVTIRTATPADFSGMLKLLIAAFSDGQPTHGLFDLIMPETIRADQSVLDHWYIAVRGAEVVASTQIVPQRFLVAPGVEVRVGGIGQVSCIPGFRGKGLMSELLNATIARMDADGYHVSILGGDRQRYRRFGWEIAGSVRSMWLHSRRIAGQPAMPDEANRPQRFIGDCRVADRIHEAYQTNISRILRSREQTHLVLKRQGLATWVHEVGGGFAYVCLSGDRIAEYGGELTALEQLVSFLLARRNFPVTIPSDEGSGAIERMFLDFAGGYSQQPVDQIRVFKLLPLLEAYRPVLEERLAGWQSSIILAMSDSGEAVKIARQGQSLNIAASNGPADLTLDRPTWAPALFGPFLPAMTCSPQTLAFMRSIGGLPIVWPLLSQI